MTAAFLAALLALPGAGQPATCKQYSRLVTAECVLAGVPVRQVWFRWPAGYNNPGHAVAIVGPKQIVVDQFGIRGRIFSGENDLSATRRIWREKTWEW